MIELGCALLPRFERSAPRFDLLPLQALLLIHELFARGATSTPNLMLLLDNLFKSSITFLLFEESLVLCYSAAPLHATPLTLRDVRPVLFLHDTLLSRNVRPVLRLCEGCRELIVALYHLLLHAGILLIDGKDWVIVRL